MSNFKTDISLNNLVEQAKKKMATSKQEAIANDEAREAGQMVRLVEKDGKAHLTWVSPKMKLSEAAEWLYKGQIGRAEIGGNVVNFLESKFTFFEGVLKEQGHNVAEIREIIESIKEKARKAVDEEITKYNTSSGQLNADRGWHFVAGDRWDDEFLASRNKDYDSEWSVKYHWTEEDKKNQALRDLQAETYSWCAEMMAKFYDRKDGEGFNQKWWDSLKRFSTKVNELRFGVKTEVGEMEVVLPGTITRTVGKMVMKDDKLVVRAATMEVPASIAVWHWMQLRNDIEVLFNKQPKYKEESIGKAAAYFEGKVWEGDVLDSFTTGTMTRTNEEGEEYNLEPNGEALAYLHDCMATQEMAIEQEEKDLLTIINSRNSTKEEKAQAIDLLNRMAA